MFCYNCGQKIMEGAKFCFNCGCDLSVVSGGQPNGNAEESVVVESTQISSHSNTGNQGSSGLGNTEGKVEAAFNKAFKSMNKFGNLVYIIGVDPIPQEIESNMVDYYLSEETGEKPLLIFDYGNQNLKEGLVISNQRIAWHFSITGQQEIELSNIKDVSMGKAVLATVMNIVSCDNIKYKSIYLTGIQDEAEFAVRFRKFVNEVYMIYHGMNEDSNEVCTKTGAESNVDFIVRACNSVNMDSTYCVIGHPTISVSVSKYDKAKCNFNIPESEQIFLIFDATVFGGCQKGFAICTTGFYYCGHQRGYLSWEQFKDVPITNGFGEIRVGFEAFNTGTDGKKLLMILRSLQECL